jgi:hypothetical protein
MSLILGWIPWINDTSNGIRIRDFEHGMLEVCRAGSLVTVSKELSKYRLDLVGVQVSWEGGGTEPAGEYTFSYGKGNENH